MDSEDQGKCLAYITWKTAFLIHLIFFFLCLAFTVGTAQTYIEDETSREGQALRRQ